MSSGRKWQIGILLAALLAAAGVAYTQEEAPLKPAPMTPVPLRGTVTLPDGSPARNARLELAVWGKGYVEATTDGAGRYRALLPDAGTLVVEAFVQGVGLSKRLVVRAGDGSREARLDIQLHGAPVLRGVVYTQEGAPAANITLARYGTVGRTDNAPPADGIPPEQTDQGGGMHGGKIEPAITTDRLGRYSIPLLDLDQKTGGWPPRLRGDGTEHKQRLISPSGLGWAELEVRVELARPEVHRDFHLQPGARVSGMLIGYPGGTAMRGVTVDVGMDLQIWMMHCWPTVEKLVSDDEGRFQGSVSLPPDVLYVRPETKGKWAIMEEEWQPADEASVGDRHVMISLLGNSTIEGRLFAPDGTPLADAHVVFPSAYSSSSPVAEVDTDGEGRYRFEIEAGHRPYGLPAHRPRYVWLVPRAAGVGVAPPVRVDVTQAALSYDFRLSAPGTVIGREVERDEGVPAVGVTATLVPAAEGVPPEELSALAGLCLDGQERVATEEETGEFRLEGVPPGEYWLELTGWTIYGLTAANGKAPRITVPAGGTVGVDRLEVGYVPGFRVNLRRGPDDLDCYRVSGYLRPAGSSGAGDEVFVWLDSGSTYTVWARRKYDIVLDPGRYEIAIAARKDASRFVSGLHTMDLTAGPAVAEVSFDLGGASVRGRVVMPDGETGIPDITVTGPAVAGDAMILNGSMHDWGHFQVDTDAEGRFSITGLLSGEYELRAHLPEEFYGPPPTLRLALSPNQQAEVVLRAERVVW